MDPVELLILTFCIILTLGGVVYAFGQKTGISTVPLLMLIGLCAGPIFELIDNELAHTLFDEIRVFGLVIILFTEGHSLRWSLLKKHMVSICLLDTIGLLITAMLSALLFTLVFDLPFAVGFLFGAVVSATDPATLVPLFKQNKVNQDIETVIVTESIFNDPLGIVLTILAIALLVPSAASAELLQQIAEYTTLYPAAVLFFIYQIGGAIILGFLLAHLAYQLAPPFLHGNIPIIASLAIGLGGFVIGEWAQVSGYLVATVIGIVFGNHERFFDRPERREALSDGLALSGGFNETLSDLATLFIFILLGATIDISALGDDLWSGVIVALGVVFVARPLAVTALLPTRRWTLKEYLFIALEGPRGVVPAAMAGALLSLGLAQGDEQLVSWGHAVMTATVVTVLISVILQTSWMKTLNVRLLGANSEGCNIAK
jgi:NhaP-type Na+/H+ or K+/H+ antiporter